VIPVIVLTNRFIFPGLIVIGLYGAGTGGKTGRKVLGSNVTGSTPAISSYLASFGSIYFLQRVHISAFFISFLSSPSKIHYISSYLSHLLAYSTTLLLTLSKIGKIYEIFADIKEGPV